MKPSYRLDAVLRVRRRRVDAARKVAAQADAAHAAAEQQRLAAIQRKERHDAAAEDVRSFDQAALESGQLTVADLQVAGDWERAVERQAALMRHQIAQREEAERRAKALADASHAVLARRHVEVTVLEKHRDAWQRTEAKKADERAEQDVHDSLRPHGGQR